MTIIFSLLLLSINLEKSFEANTPVSEKVIINEVSPTIKNINQGNKKISSFSKAKKFALEIYKGMETTFYCGCKFENKIVNHQSCGFIPKHESPRSFRVEWEHVVPAYNFGRSFKEWTQGHPACVNNQGKKFKGRKCARKTSKEFNLMESDLYNLVPAIGEVNGNRGHLPIGLVDTLTQKYGACETKISNLAIEPRDQIKGFIARTYKYMHLNYPGHGIISKKNRKLFDEWDKRYPPSPEEYKRAQRIFLHQENKNQFLIK